MKQVLNTSGLDRTKACFQWLTGQGVLAWSAVTAYIPGDMVATSGGFLWRCVVGNTNIAPSSSTSAYWLPADPKGERNPIIRDAFFIGPPINYPGTGFGTTAQANFGAYPIVDGDIPIKYAGAGTPITFTPFAIAKDKLTYKVGFESQSVSLTLRPRDNTQLYSAAPMYTRGDGTALSEGIALNAPYADPYTVVGTSGSSLLQSMKQSFSQSDWYLAPVTILRFFIPNPLESTSPLDVTSYGAAVMFRGRVSEIEVDQEEVRLNVASLMEIFKQKVPTQTIQPGNRWAPFDFQYSPDFTGSMSLPADAGFNWITVSISGSAPSVGQLAEGWALITVAGVGQWWRRIYTNLAHP